VVGFSAVVQVTFAYGTSWSNVCFPIGDLKTFSIDTAVICYTAINEDTKASMVTYCQACDYYELLTILSCQLHEKLRTSVEVH